MNPSKWTPPSNRAKFTCSKLQMIGTNLTKDETIKEASSSPAADPFELLGSWYESVKQDFKHLIECHMKALALDATHMIAKIIHIIKRINNTTVDLERHKRWKVTRIPHQSQTLLQS